MQKSISEGISLNRLVRRALEKEVGMIGRRRVKDSEIDAMVAEIYEARTRSRARKPPF